MITTGNFQIRYLSDRMLAILFIISQVTKCQQISSNNVNVLNDMTCGTESSDLYCNTNKEHIDKVILAKDIDDFSRNRYETIDIAFNNGEYNVTSNFFGDLQSLFQSHPQSKHVEFRVKFQNFKALYLNDHFFNSICDNVHSDVECHLTLNVYNSKNANFIVSPGAFQGLQAHTLVIHNAHLSGTPFQILFKNAKIKNLDLKGTYIDSDDRIPFTGYIEKVILMKQASNLDTEEFPKFPVSEYVINAQNIQSINGDSFENYDNIKELHLKSKSLVIRPGNLVHFRNLKKITLEDVIVESGGFQDLEGLENLEIGSGVSMRPDAISEIGKLKNLKKIRMNSDEQTMDVRMMCELATSISQLPSQLSEVDISVGKKCTCEHKFIAHFKQMYNHECYKFDDECTKTSCQIVNDYFTAPQSTKTYDQYMIEMGPKLPDFISEDHYIKTSQHDDELTVHYSTLDDNVSTVTTPIVSTGAMFNDKGLIPSGKVSKMNWLPIVIVTGILLIILVCGLVAYLLRMFSNRRREFKPIPTGEGYVNSGQTAATVSKP